MIETNDPGKMMTGGVKLIKSHSVDSICSQDEAGLGLEVVVDSRKPTNGRFSNFKPSGGLRKKISDSKQNQSMIAAAIAGPKTERSSNKLSKLKKQSAMSSYDLKEISNNQSKAERAPPLSLMQKLLLDEQKIYSDPNDNYKRRTVVLVRPKSNGFSSSNAYLNRSISTGGGTTAQSGEFGFNLQAYGFLNKLTQQTEYICFVRNVEANSPASRAGLQSGDVLLAIDGVCLNEFRSFAEITAHVRGKNELRLVLMAENVSKRIQCQLRAEQIRRILAEKRAQLEKVNAQAEELLKKYGVQYSLSSEVGSNTSSSSGVNSESKCSGDGFSLTNSTSSSLSTSTTTSLRNSSLSTTTALNANSTPESSKETPGVGLMINESSIFMSPPSSSLSTTNMLINQSLISSSDVASEDVASSSLSQSSSFSSAALNGNSTSSSTNKPVIKSSTPVDASTTNGSNSHHFNPVHLGGQNPRNLEKTPSSILTAPNYNENIKQPDANGVKVMNGPGLYKQSSQANSSGGSGGKPSLARKYFESTSRLVRSASSSSMNLFSSLKSSLSSNNINKATITQPASSETRKKLINYSPSFSIPNNRSSNERHSISTTTDDSSSLCSSSSNRANSLIDQVMNPSRMSNGRKQYPQPVSDRLENSGEQKDHYKPPPPSYNPRLTAQYSSDRVVVKLNNHYNDPNNSNPKPKYHRNELKNIFSLLSSKPKISSRMNRYRLDAAAAAASGDKNASVVGQRTSCPVPSDSSGSPLALGRSVSCDFTAAQNNNSSLLSSSNQDYSIPVIDYSNEDYVITRL